MALRHRPHRILYVPLDDRPYNVRVPRLLAEMVEYDLVSPPAEMLGRFRTPGQPDEIAQWLRAHADAATDCMILSLDMLAYGGLWASRSSGTRTQLAQERLDILGELRTACPESTIYASNVILRLGIVASADEAALHYGSLFRHSELAGRVAEKPNDDDRESLCALEREIPAAVLGEYLAVRERNLAINLRGVRDVAEGNVDFLALGQDTCAEDGVHREEQARLREACEELGVDDRVAMEAGADQLGMCLLARFVHHHMDKTPAVRVLRLAGLDDDRVVVGEDRPFAASVASHMALIGAVECEAEDRLPDMVLAINSPAPYERSALQDPEIARSHRERARSFVAEAATAAEGRGLAVCDVAFPNGSDDIFVQELIAATAELPGLLTYAGWNTASNAVGSALAHGTLRLICLQDKGAFDLARLLGDMSPMRYLELLDSVISSEKAHIRMLLSRFADDWLYQSRIRSRVTEHICDGLRSGVFDLSRSYQQAESLMRDELTEAISDLWIDQFLGRPCVSIGSDRAEDEQSSLVLAGLDETRLGLPWRRLFEVEVELDFGVQLVAHGEGLP